MADIKTLNDNFRKTFLGGQVLVTEGIRSKPTNYVSAILTRVRNFNNFTKSNDPYGEHETSLSFARKKRPQQGLVVRASRKL